MVQLKLALLCALVCKSAGENGLRSRELSGLFSDEKALEEFKERTRYGFVPLSPEEQENMTTLSADSKNSEVAARSSLPESVDWRSRMTDVKYQGGCAVCWAFVATAMVEFRLAVDYSLPVVSMSEQHLLDCNKLGVNNGCEGGNFYSALKNWLGSFYVAESYPFITDKTGQEKRKVTVESDQEYCSDHYTVNGVAKLELFDGYLQYVTPRTEYALMQAVALGPVGIAISGYSDSFLKYTGGILDPSECGDDVDHAAVVVGYGTSNDGIDYWLVRNSWSTAWGENGFIRLKRGTQSTDHPFGTCGILFQANYLQPGAISCTVGDGRSCSDFANSLFCTEEYGCESEQFYAQKFSLSEIDPDESGSSVQSKDSKVIIIVGSVCGVVVLLSAAYVVYARYYKPHLDPSLKSPKDQDQVQGFSISAYTESQVGTEPFPREREKIEQMRAKLSEMSAAKSKARTETDEVLLRYLRQNNGRVSSALNDYVASEIQ